MTKEEIIADLILNPKYSSSWVDEASQILSIFTDATLEFVEQYDSDQLPIVQSMLKYRATENGDFDIDAFANPELNSTQMQILFTAAAQLKDNDKIERLKALAKPEYAYAKTNWITKAFTEGLDIIDHVEDYSAEQIAMIYHGYKDGVDYTQYDSPYISSNMMRVMEHCLVLGYSISYEPKTNTLMATEFITTESEEE